MIDFSLIQIVFSATPLDFWFADDTPGVSVSTVGPSGPFVSKNAAQNGEPWAELAGSVFSFYFDPAAMGLGEGEETYLKIAYDGVELTTSLDVSGFVINDPPTTSHYKIYATLPVS